MGQRSGLARAHTRRIMRRTHPRTGDKKSENSLATPCFSARRDPPRATHHTRARARSKQHVLSPHPRAHPHGSTRSASEVRGNGDPSHARMMLDFGPLVQRRKHRFGAKFHGWYRARLHRCREYPGMPCSLTTRHAILHGLRCQLDSTWHRPPVPMTPSSSQGFVLTSSNSTIRLAVSASCP